MIYLVYPGKAYNPIWTKNKINRFDRSWPINKSVNLLALLYLRSHPIEVHLRNHISDLNSLLTHYIFLYHAPWICIQLNPYYRGGLYREFPAKVMIPSATFPIILLRWHSFFYKTTYILHSILSFYLISGIYYSMSHVNLRIQSETFWSFTLNIRY